MKLFHQHDIQTSGVQCHSDGSPSTRALGRHLVILQGRFNDLAADVNDMQDKLNRILAALDRLNEQRDPAEAPAPRDEALRRIFG